MRIFSTSELSRYSCATLRALEARMRQAILALPEHAIERDFALENLRNIRRVLISRRTPSGPS